MKAKIWFFLPSVSALLFTAAPVIPAFTNIAIAAPFYARGWDGKFEQLNLTDAQRAQIQQIREAARQQMDEVLTPAQREQMRIAREQRQKPNLNLSEEQKAKMRAIRENSRIQMEAVLTSEQKQKLQEMRLQRQQRRQQKQF